MADGALAVVRVPTPRGRPEYAGDTVISGVPGTAARIVVEFRDTTRALLPTGRVADELGGVRATLIGNGTPLALVAARSLGVTGYESPARLEYDDRLRARVETLRMAAGELMGLSDVRQTKVCLLAPPVDGGSLSVRSFLAHRVDPGLGVLAAIGVGAAAVLPGSVASALAAASAGTLRLEHPSGFVDVVAEADRPAVVSTARLLLDGRVHVHV